MLGGTLLLRLLSCSTSRAQLPDSFSPTSLDGSPPSGRDGNYPYRYTSDKFKEMALPSVIKINHTLSISISLSIWVVDQSLAHDQQKVIEQSDRSRSEIDHHKTERNGLNYILNQSFEHMVDKRLTKSNQSKKGKSLSRKKGQNATDDLMQESNNSPTSLDNGNFFCFVSLDGEDVFDDNDESDKLVFEDSKESDRNRIAILEKDHTENERDEAEYPESANEESDTDDENATEDEKSDKDEESDEDGVVEKVTKLEELKRRISIMKTNKQGYYSNKCFVAHSQSV
ncbi:hypothetical protein OUZ56_023800 [Daphnia magna]|uniref:Uncharacterized protein n=1 Tax=Daphnia magna TaxID=35525 RepID=A0ABR0B087_9CRUS|nr:hypothetical protein OUZ56_023800 [Daphnia magna]